METQNRCSNTETNGGKGRRMMEDNVMRTEIETQEDDNGGDGDTG